MIPAAAQLEEHSFHLERLFPAPPEVIFRLWTHPDYVQLWWGIKGSTIPFCELDVRPGGKWRIDMRTASGKVYRNQGTYLEVDAPYRLVFDDVPDPELDEWQGQPPGRSVQTVTLTGHEGKTRVRLDVHYASAADRERMLALGVREGMTQGLDRLGTLLAASVITLAANAAEPPIIAPDAERLATMTQSGLSYTISADGTQIAYARTGAGTPLVVVTGAFNDHATGAALVEVLAERFTVYTYDRRGRGASGDAPAYSIQKEIEDLAAIVALAGEPVSVLGFSSGALLALEAADAGLAIDSLILVEPPLMAGELRPKPPEGFAAHLKSLIEAGERGQAVEDFQRDFVGIPQEFVEQLRHAPFRPALEAMAHTLVYDATLAGDLSIPKAMLARISVPVLVMNGEESAPWLRHSAPLVADLLPDGRHVEVPEVGHDLVPALAPGILGFLGE